MTDSNRKLCEKYPFLKINDLDGDPYAYTWLDDVPDGWRKAFVEQMCEEIKQALLEKGGEKSLHEYEIMQIKEKYGTLRWYDFNAPSKVQDIIDKYEDISADICIKCGESATVMTTGWIRPYCDECAKKLQHRNFIPITKKESRYA